MPELFCSASPAREQSKGSYPCSDLMILTGLAGAGAPLLKTHSGVSAFFPQLFLHGCLLDMLKCLASLVTIYITVLLPSLPGKMALNSGLFFFPFLFLLSELAG